MQGIKATTEFFWKYLYTQFFLILVTKLSTLGQRQKGLKITGKRQLNDYLCLSCARRDEYSDLGCSRIQTLVVTEGDNSLKR